MEHSSTIKNPVYALLVAGVLVTLGILTRILPHEPNLASITAITLFASAYVGLRYSIVVTLLAMFLSDLVIGMYDWKIMLCVYGSFLLIGIVGLVLNKRKRIAPVIGVTAVSSGIFFLITNWAVWQFGTMYPHTMDGLMQSYIAALPFLRNSFIGDMLYVGVLFGGFEAARSIVTSLQKKKILVSEN